MPTVQELEERRDSIRAQIDELGQRDDHTVDDQIFIDSLIAEHDQLEEQIKPIRHRMAQLDRIRQAAAEESNREEPAVRSESPQLMRRVEPLEELDLERVRTGLVERGELRSRALALIDQDNAKRGWVLDDSKAQEATLRVEAKPKLGQHVLLTGGDAYREAFRSYLEDPLNSRAYEGTLYADLGGDNSGNVYRAIQLGNASGGYLLPYVLDPTIVLTNNASANPFRRVSRIVQTTSNAWQGVSSAGVNAALVAETATAADASPSDFAQIQIKPQKFAVWVLGTYEALDDTDFGVQLPGLLADGKDRIESQYFATGSGTNAPLGIVTALGTSGRVVPSTTGTAFNGTASLPDIGLLMAAVPPRFRRSASCAFMANIVHINRIRQMDQYGGGGFWANLTSSTPPSLYGYPIYEGSDLPSATTGSSAASGTASDTLFLGDWNQFIIADRVGVSMLYDPLIKGTGAAAQLPAGEAGWYMFWRTSSGISTTAAFRNLTIS